MKAFTHLILLALPFITLATGQTTAAVSTTTDTASSSPVSTNIADGTSSPEASTTTITVSSSPVTASSASSPTSTAGPSITTASTAPSASSPTSAAGPSTTPTSTAPSASSLTSAASPSTTPTSTASSASSPTSAAGPSTTPTSTPADSESTTVTTIAVSFTDDTSAIIVSSLPTQSNSETSPITKNNSLVITSAKPQSSGTSTSTSNPGTTGTWSPCQDNPCARNSACVKLYDTHFCLCSEGYYYNHSACLKGKTFPGKIAVKVSETVGLEDQTSLAYQGLYTEIVDFFMNILGTSYGQTVILDVSASPSSSARSEVRAGDEVVTVTMVNILTLDTNGTQETVSALIKSAINGTNITDYIWQDRCDYYGCVEAEDGCIDTLACTCKDGWERINPQVAFCFASSPKCPENCSGEHRQCLIKEDKSSECACEPGYKEDDDGNCQPCPFGYSGLECQDQFQLILTIMGTIAGVLILSMVIAVIITARSRNKEKNIEEQKLIEEDFQNLRLRPTGFSNLGAQGRMFPKIRVAGSRDSLSPNPYAQADMPHPDY